MTEQPPTGHTFQFWEETTGCEPPTSGALLWGEGAPGKQKPLHYVEGTAPQQPCYFESAFACKPPTSGRNCGEKQQGKRKVPQRHKELHNSSYIVLTRYVETPLGASLPPAGIAVGRSSKVGTEAFIR